MPARGLRRELRWLRAYAIGSSLLMIVLTLEAFRSQARQRFEEIDVERLNIVEPNGSPRLVFTNTPRSPGLIEKGLPFGDTALAGKRGGIIFYNDDATEAGGIAVRGHRIAGGTVAHGGLSFDRFEQEDVVMLDYDEEAGRHSQGLKIADRSDVPLKQIIEALAPIQRMPNGPTRDAALQRFRVRYGARPGGVIRLFVGRDTAANSTIDLKDGQGRTRLRLVVDTAGRPAIEFLNAGGQVERSIRGSTR